MRSTGNEENLITCLVLLNSFVLKIIEDYVKCRLLAALNPGKI
jgi:hypothetical protein